MSITRRHFEHLLTLATDIIADEVRRCVSMGKLYPCIGDLKTDLQLSYCREGHFVCLLFDGFRASGYFTLAQGNYFVPKASGRQIDLTIWLPDAQRWLYMEVEPCGTQAGLGCVPGDAAKLITDAPTDQRDGLRALLVYGFGTETCWQEKFRDKYRERLNRELGPSFSIIDVLVRPVGGDPIIKFVQTGLWVVGDVDTL